MTDAQSNKTAPTPESNYASDWASRVRIVLVNSSHPGNIGSAARALKTMGLSQLVLVAPLQFPHGQATAMASGADDILANARVCADLPEALHGCVYVYASSARRREVSMPELDARSFAADARQRALTGEIAVVFGSERVGLTNEQIELCQCLVQIPSNPAYASLNLAAAVQILSYELRYAALADSSTQEIIAPRLRLAGSSPALEHKPATNDQLEGFFAHLAKVLGEIGFYGTKNPPAVLRRLRRIYQRAAPDEREVRILRGILTQTSWAIANPEKLTKPTHQLIDDAMAQFEKHEGNADSGDPTDQQ
jgi:tRNA (cytidine32/uridine32-2'-O)-methyltransferase